MTLGRVFSRPSPAAPKPPGRGKRGSPSKARPSGGLGDPITTFAAGLLLGVALRFADGRMKPQSPAGAGGAAPLTSVTAPLQMSPRQWRKVFQRALTKFSKDQIPAAAAGVTFFGLLALFPALSAFASLYGLFANVEDARRQVVELAGLLPGGAVTVIGDQMERLAQADHGGLGLAFVSSLLVSLWSSNAGMKAMLGGLNAAYEEREKRNFIALNGVSLCFTLGATLFSVLAMGAVVAAPIAIQTLGLSDLVGLSLLRWPILLLVVVALLSLLYRYGPSRERARARWRWITPGSVVASLGWMLLSAGFSWYVGNYGHYNQTYGSLGAVVGFMTWIWLSLNVVLFGAELNAELEMQTTADTTTGAAEPAGARGAAVADAAAA